MLKRLLFFCVLSLLIVGQTYAQSRSVRGKVTDADTKEGIPGVSVSIKGTTSGTTTDTEGNYEVQVADGAVLIFQGIGLETQEVSVGAQSTLDVVMKSESKQLGEVVVVGYGVQERAEVTGAIAGMKNTEIENIPVNNVAQAMQGRIAGVQVQGTNGRPGSGMVIRVRGQASISAGNNPLYVVDGVILTNSDDTQSGAGQGFSPLSFLNQEDIASIEVLKDASATAIYGSRASNGVVLITTKSGGKNQKAQISFSAYTGFQDLTNRLNLLNANQYREVLRDARANAGLPVNPAFAADPNIQSTDWQNEVLKRNSRISNYQLSVSGGNDKTRFYTSLNYMTQDAILKIGFFERISARLNIDHQASKKFNFGLKMSFANTRSRQTTTDNSIFSAFPLALQSRPDQSVFNPATGLFSLNTYNNPVHAMLLPEYVSNVSQIISTAYAQYEILDGLKFKTQFSTDMMFTRDFEFEPTNSIQAAGSNGRGLSATGWNVNLLTESTLNYTKLFFDKKLKVDALLGYTYQNITRELNSVSGIQFPSNATPYLVSAGTIQTGSSNWTSNGLESFLGRVNLEWDDKYLLSLAIRRDGSSKFVNNKYGTFPSLSVGWRISSENFMKDIKVINDLKVRASWGRTGNQEGIGNFASRRLIGTGANYQDLPGFAISQIGNADLRWESTEQTNIGLDATILKNRVTFKFDYYNRDTKDLLLAQPIPITSGFNSFTNNIGTVRNRGFEIELQTVNIEKNGFKWVTNFNVARNTNTITKLFNDTPIDNGFVSRNAVGQAIGSFFLIQSLGVDPQTGDMIYKDTNEDGLINGLDRQFLGNPFPTYFGGLTNTLTYKGFELSVFFTFSEGNKVYKLYEEGTGGVLNAGADANSTASRNMTIAVLDRWREPGQVTYMPRAVAGARGVFNTQRSSRFLEDGSFIRLRNITFAYSLPKEALSRIGFSQVRVYFTAQNLLTFTKYSGMDPEASSAITSADQTNAFGVDQAGIPQLKSYTIGVNLGF